jgi:hypothetical protein
MEYIDRDGNTQRLGNKQKFLTIHENEDIIEIVKFSKKLKNIVISNNKNLKTISSFPTILEELYITNNESLEYMLEIPPITSKLVIYENPKMIHIDNIIDKYKASSVYKHYYPDIITELEESDDDSSIFSIGMELENEDLHIDDLTFTTNIEEYKKSPSYLHNDSKYLISYKEYQGYSYPIVTLPKGTILYNCGKGNNLNVKEKYQNLYNLEEDVEFETQLKFFYPVPYAAKLGIDIEYNICNIVATNHDMQIICLISPAPQSNETLRLPTENKVTHETMKGVNYYKNGLTIPCEIYDHDLCIDTNMMKEMNVQGYICIAHDDSISHGKTWYKNMDKESMKVYKDYIEEYLFKSSLSSVYKENNNLDYINKKLNMELPEALKHRMFGIPEIVLTPLKTDYFFTIDQKEILKKFHSIRQDTDFRDKESDMQKIFRNMFNYVVIEICNMSELKSYIERIENNILSNKQCQVLQLFADKYVDPDLAFHLRHEKLNFDDVNYTLAYLKKNDKNPYCAFETIGYHLLQIPTIGKRITYKSKTHKGGKTKRRTLSILRYRKRPRLFTQTSRRYINIQDGGGEGIHTRIVFERTRGGIPIAYTIAA